MWTVVKANPEEKAKYEELARQENESNGIEWKTKLTMCQSEKLN
jgi:hypothetical protein